MKPQCAGDEQVSGLTSTHAKVHVIPHLMHKKVSAAVFRRDEAEAFAGIKPLDGAFALGLLPLRHGRGGGVWGRGGYSDASSCLARSTEDLPSCYRLPRRAPKPGTVT